MTAEFHPCPGLRKTTPNESELGDAAAGMAVGVLWPDMGAVIIRRGVSLPLGDLILRILAFRTVRESRLLSKRPISEDVSGNRLQHVWVFGVVSSELGAFGC